MNPTERLTDRERATLAAICDAFHPSLTAEPGDDEMLFAMSASELGVPGAVEESIALVAPALRAELRQFLGLLDNAAFGLFAGGTFRGAARMSREQRTRLLEGLATSKIPQLRSGFQALRRLSSLMFYCGTDANGHNPAWERIQYEPSARPPAVPRRLTTTTVTSDTTIDADACIVGSGAGGGVVAAELASRGMTVVVVEAGPGDQSPDFDQRELDGLQRLYLDRGLAASKDLGVAILAGACLGGGTTVNWQTSLRTPDDIRDEWAERSGCGLFTGDRFTRALDEVCARLGVSANESFVNANNAPIQRGCAALGYSWSPIERNSMGCDTSQCGYCTFGCRVGGKQTTTVTYLRDAQQMGDTTIITGCSARRVVIANGRVTGVEAVAGDAAGHLHRVTIRSSRVVVAAGGIHSPALLQRSGLTLPQLGRNLFLHPTTAVAGFYPELVQPWCGPPQTILCDQFGALDGRFGFRLESAPVHPGLFATAFPWTSARHHRRLMQRCAHASAIIALTRDSSGGRVDTRRDGTAVIEYVPGRAERALLARGIAEAACVHLAAGAHEVVTLHTRALVMRPTAATTASDITAFRARVLAEPVDGNWSGLFSAHQMGTCRFGRDRASAVCDERGEVFGVRGLYVADASAFPASSGVNPMITVMAVAKCVAEGIG